MDKFKIIRKMKKYKEKNERTNTKENNIPNRISFNKARTHIKIKSHDIKYSNVPSDEESDQKMNIINFKTDNKILNPLHKSKLKQNKTENNLLALKLNKKVNKNNSNNKYKANNINNNSEAYKKLLNLWEELGVNYIYQSIFNKNSNSLNKEKKENYFIYELNKLNNIFNIINSIVNNINERDNIIFQLHKNYYEDIVNDTEDANNYNYNYDEKTIKKIISILLDLRKYSFEIVSNIVFLRKEIVYDIIMNKYDINKIIVFPADYLVKMNNDLDFLINTPLNKYFNFSKSDPFLIKLNIVNSNTNNNNLNNIYELPKIKEENILAIIKNYDYLILDELVNQEVNLVSINSKTSFDSIFNFEPLNKIIKKNNNKLNIKKIQKAGINNNNAKADRGLSHQKLRTKVNNNNKMAIDSEISNLSNAKANNNHHILKNSNTHFMHDDKNYISENNNNNNNFDEEGNEDNQYNKNKPNNIILNNPINEDDIKIFEKIIEQSIMEKNNIDKETDLDNKIKKIKSSYKKRKQKAKIRELSLNTSMMPNKFKDRDEMNEEKGIKDKKIKKDISNFINDILEEKEI